MVAASAWDVVVVGGGNTDYVVRGPRLPAPGETVQGDVFLEGPGGKGANQAVAVARLGGRVALVARLGGDRRGDAIVARLAGEGVDVANVVRDPSAPTGAALVLLDDRGQKQIAAALGANRRLDLADVRAARPAIESARVLLAQLEVPLESVREALRLARRAGALVVLDPAPAMPLPDELLREVDVIRPNATEAMALTGVEVTDRPSARRAARALIARGVGAAIVEGGLEGNLLVWRHGEAWLERHPVHAIDATGSGDAFAAAVALGLAEGCGLPEAAARGSAAAALASTRLGAQAALPRRHEVLRLLDERNHVHDARAPRLPPA